MRLRRRRRASRSSKAFWGRYYNNFDDRARRNAIPAATNHRNYKFNDLNGNRLYDGVQELGALVASAGGSTTTVDPRLQVAVRGRDQRALEQQFWGESSVRVAYVRKMVAQRVRDLQRRARRPVHRAAQRVDASSGLRQPAGPGTQTFNVFDIPDSLRGVRCSNVIASIPTASAAATTTTTPSSSAFNKRWPGGLFLQSSFDYQWRDELRARRAKPSNSPLNTDPLGVGYFQNVFPEVSNRQQTTNWQGRLMGRYVFTNDIGVAVN